MGILYLYPIHGHPHQLHVPQQSGVSKSKRDKSHLPLNYWSYAFTTTLKAQEHLFPDLLQYHLKFMMVL